MFDRYAAYARENGEAPPDWQESITYIKSRGNETVPELLEAAARDRRVMVQPRCGLGDYDAMGRLLVQLERDAAPDILSLTIDAHTRLLQLARARTIALTAPQNLNGYPLLAYGWEKTRRLAESIKAPLEVRHGSPDARLLFVATIASGITSFEGGGISYNIPYSKKVPLADSLAYWQEVDQMAGDLGRAGIIVDRELFGTLTAVLMPPCIALAVSIIEARLAADAGVRCISIAYPQTGHLVQDVAALRLIPRLAAKYLPADVNVYPVLHQFMGAFPRARHDANALIVLASLTARLGGAVKCINKTYQEAFGVPTAAANVDGITMSQIANSWILDVWPIDQAGVGEEEFWIEREVDDLLTPLFGASDLREATVDAFNTGRLDVPFSASVYAKASVLPVRDSGGAVRILRPGVLPFSAAVEAHHRRKIASVSKDAQETFFEKINADISFFSRHRQPPPAVPRLN